MKRKTRYCCYKFIAIFSALFSLSLTNALAMDPDPINTERPSFSASPLAPQTGFC